MTRPSIVPNGVPEGAYAVKPFAFSLRLMCDYDVNFMRDRLRAEIFIGDNPSGTYACADVSHIFDTYGKEGARYAIEEMGPELERMAVDSFMGLGYRKQVTALEKQVAELVAHRDRPRWFHFRPVRRAVGRFRHSLGSIFTDVGDLIKPSKDPA